MKPGAAVLADPLAFERELRRAAEHFARSEWADAERALLRIVEVHPSAVALHFLSIIANSTGRHELALERAQAALGLDRQRPELHVALGRAYKALGRLPEAVDAYERALHLRPDFLDARVSLGIAQRQLGRLDDAIDNYRTVLAREPRHAEALGNLGNALAERVADRHGSHVTGDDLREAIEVQRRALDLAPRNAKFMHNLALSLKHTGRYEEATEFFNRALGTDPTRVDTCLEFGDLLFKEQRLDLARDLFTRWLDANPDHAEVQFFLANVLVEMGETEEAVSRLERVAEARPDWPPVEHLRGKIRLQQFNAHDDVDSTLAHFARALEARPDYFEAVCSYLLTCCYVEEDPLRLAFEHRRRVSALGPPAPRPPADRTGWPARRLRVGYVSYDFKRHSVAYFIEALLESHDRTRFEVHAYKTNAGQDATTARLRGLCEHWIECSHLSDEQLAERIRSDRIDVLVDLSGLTSGSRLLVFNRRAAPCQMTYLGYPTTTGAACFDFRLTDAIIDPEGCDSTDSEMPLRLPHTMFCHRPGKLPDLHRLPALERGAVTFGSFNNLSKVGSHTLDLWASTLRAVPRSRLLLKSQALMHHGTRKQLLGELERRDVDPERIVLKPWERAVESHLCVYNEVDIGLDTFPFNGATTTCEALSMGVPVVTVSGPTHPSRMGASILSAAGLASCVARSDAQYVEIAAHLARDLAELARLRAGMRERLAASRLHDRRAFTLDFERALVQAFETSAALQAGS